MKRRSYVFAAALAAAALALGSSAPAAVVMSTGIRYVIPTGTKTDCSAKAQQALGAFLENAAESTPGSGEWLAVGPPGATTLTASAVVSCLALPKGYVVTFTCTVQSPDNPYSADDLCLNVAHTFSGKAVKPLATSTPAPTGCTTANLVGTWVSNNKPGLTMTLSPTGELLDSDGVSGNWALYNNTATLTYYGTHSLTLSPDGKHLRGEGYDLTRKC
jgi:hypothetical protein